MQEETASNVPSLAKLRKLANSKKFDQLSELWPQAVANSEYDRDDLLAVAGQVGRLGDTERADGMAMALIEHAELERGQRAALDVVRRAAHEIPHGAEKLRVELRRLYETLAPDFPELTGLLDVVCDEGADLGRAADRLDLYLQIRPGAYITDFNWVLPGVVESVDDGNGVVVVRFDDRRNEYGPSTLGKIKPRPDDFFPALIIYDPERLRQLAQDDPVSIVKLALQADIENRLAYKDLKQHVTRLLGEKGWTAWWKDARERLKHDPLLGMSAGSQPTFKLLRSADRYEDRLRRRFDRTPEPVEKLKRILAYLDETARSGGEFGADEELLVHFGNGAAKIAIGALNEKPVLALAALAIHAVVAARGVAVARPNPKAAAQVIARIADAGELPVQLPDALVQPTLNFVREALPDRWSAVWAQVMLRSGRRLCDQLGRGLVEAEQIEDLHAVLRTAVAKPTASPELICWLWRARQGGGNTGRTLMSFSDLVSYDILFALLQMTDAVGTLHAVSGEERHLKVLEGARSDLMIGKADPLITVIREADAAQAGRLKNLLIQNQGLNPSLQSRLKHVLRAEHPELFQEMARPWEDESILWSTEEGLRRRQNELNHIIQVEIPEVARQIGEAASFGDLSENAEWTAAIEKRDQLASRANTMENELKLAKVIGHDLAGSDHVNIGTRVTARDADSGEESVYVFLGPWDSEAERGILFYGAPLAQAFMGARVGETVAYGEGPDRRQWEILAVESAIA